MTEREKLRRDAKTKMDSIRLCWEVLDSMPTVAIERIGIRKTLLVHIEEMKKIFERLERLESSN